MGQQAPGTDQPAIKPSSPPGSPLALRNWRVTWRLIALIAIPTMMGLVFGGLRLAAANSSANEFSQVKHLAVVGQQVTGLVQALEDERDITTGYVAAGRPATRFAQLKKQYAVTDAWVARVGNLADGIGSAYHGGHVGRA
jgi:Nitrate and nitrite sensing